MKKLLSVILMLVLVACVFSACKENKPAESTDSSFTSSDTSSVESDITSSQDTSSKAESLKPESSESENNQIIQTTPLAKHQLPDYDLESDFIREVEMDGRYIKMKLYANVGEYNSYVSQLLKAGYTKYSENKIGNNRFCSLTNKTTFVSVGFTEVSKALRITSEPLGTLYPRKSENKYNDRGMQSLFTGIKSVKAKSYAGLNFVIRLSDGSFIIIDGGEGGSDGTPETSEAKYLMDLLLEQAPKGTKKPTIAAWIFTHLHSDHTGLFESFAAEYANDVVVETFYYSFPSKEDMTNTHNERNLERFNKALNYFKSTKYIRPHSGEQYYIRNAVIDMLFTVDDLVPQTFENAALRDQNDASLIFKLTIGGQSMLITGDVNDGGSNFVSKNFADFIKCDILQMAHHGQNGTEDLYSKVNPLYVLLPMNHTDTNRYTFNAANKWLVNSKRVRQFICFDKQTVTIPLPYNPKDSDIASRIPDATNPIYKEYPIH